MKKVLLGIGLFIMCVIMVLSPFGIFWLVGHSQPHVYSKTYYAALVDKVENLKKVKNEKKIILIGGSNVAFGFNSELLEEEFPDYKVVNFGLYAMLGTKIMMDLATEYINEGDLVFILPEINSQSTSLFFNAEATLKATEDNTNIIKSLPSDNRLSVYGSYFHFVNERGKQKEIIEPSGVYQRKSFNKYGDIDYRDDEQQSKRQKNRLPLHFDASSLVDFNYDIPRDFIEYVNNFYDLVKSKKGTCFYSWSPVNDLSTQNSIDEIDSYYWQLRSQIKATVVGDPANYIIDNHYFYDSNFHLNDNGAILRTLLFIEDYYRDVLNVSKDLSNLYPEKPDYETDDIDTSVDSENYDDFAYIENDNNLEIVGVKNKDLHECTLPSVAFGKVVSGIGSEAFEDSQIVSIKIPPTIHYIRDGAFSNSLVEEIYMESSDPDNTNVSWDGGLLTGVTPSFTIYVPSNSIPDYKNNYFWGSYSERIRGY